MSMACVVRVLLLLIGMLTLSNAVDDKCAACKAVAVRISFPFFIIETRSSFLPIWFIAEYGLHLQEELEIGLSTVSNIT